MILPVLAGGDVGDPLPGDPYALRGLAAQIVTLAGDLQQAGSVLGTIDSVTWRGSAAVAFRGVLHQQPGRYAGAAEAYAIAASAVSAYANALEEAQGATARAAQLSEAAAEASRRWQAEGAASPKLLAGPDPGWPDQQLAVAIDSAARSALAEVSATASAALRAAAEGAPRRPGFFHQVAGDWGALLDAPVNGAIGFAKGVSSSAAGLFQMAKLYEAETNPFLELIDPAAGAHGRDELSALAAGVTEHPLAFAEAMGKNLVSWDEWSKNPEQAAGQILPIILIGMVTDGGSVGAEGAGEAADAAAGAVAKVVEESENQTHLLSIRSAGSGPRLQMTESSVQEAARKYGIDISNIDIRIAKSRMGYFGSTAPDGSIVLTRDAFLNEEQLARTLEHERFHSVEQIGAGMDYPLTYDAADSWEIAAQIHEDTWWSHHPLNPGVTP